MPRWFNRGDYQAVEIQRVPDRSDILFHVGNTPADVVGCIAVTTRLGCLGGQWAGLGSRPAFKKFMDYYGEHQFILTINRY